MEPKICKECWIIYNKDFNKKIGGVAVRNLFSKMAYVVSDRYIGIFDLDNFSLPIRCIAEDLGFLRSYACFEVIEAKGLTLFHGDDHFDRLIKSMDLLRLVLPKGKGEMSHDIKNYFRKIVQDTLLYNHVKNNDNSLVRICVTGGHTSDGFSPDSPCSVYVFITPFKIKKVKKNEGIRIRRLDYSRDFFNVKTTNYCAAEAVMPYFNYLGFDDVLYSKNGCVLESSMANFFIVSYDNEGIPTIKTARSGILHGVTRKIVLRLAEKRGCVEEGVTTWDEVMQADEAFVTSTTKFVLPVTKIDNMILPVGNMTLELRKDFLRYRREYFKKHFVGIVER